MPVAAGAPAVTTEESAVRVEDLVKRYPKSPVDAVAGVSFDVAPGTVFGLLGPNGAGKTTTVGMLTTRVKATAGKAFVGGVDVFAQPVLARSRLAVVPQRSNLDRSLSIRDNLLFHAAYHGVPVKEARVRADSLLDQFGLAERGGTKPDMFSGGQAQRVMIARALMHRPQVMFLDEPSTGLDPAARLFVWDRLRELTAAGVTLVLTTHDMHEAATLSDRVGIMDHGKLLALDTPDGLLTTLPGRATLEVTTTDPGERDGLLDQLQGLPGVERREVLDTEADDAGQPQLRVRLYLSGDAATLVAPVATLLADRGLPLNDVDLGVPTLEDVFIHLTGRALR